MSMNVCMSVCLWICVLLSGCVHMYVMEGLGMTLSPARLYRSASALAAMLFISAADLPHVGLSAVRAG